MTGNVEVVLRRPVEQTPAAADFELVDRPMPNVRDGALLVRVLVQSLDPYIGTRLRGRHMGEPAPPPGTSLPGFSVGEVIESGDPAFAPGDRVVSEAGWARYGLAPASTARLVDKALTPSLHLGLLGMPGLTAWAGVTQLSKVASADIFLVDAAAGAVGGVAGQIARNLGARTIGVAGGVEKCALVRDIYGFDACIDRKAEGWEDALSAACAPGPTVHFENVGLSVLLPALKLLQPYGRVVLCGMTEHYHGAPAELPVGLLIGKRAQVSGLVVYDFQPRWAEWTKLARGWLDEGRIHLAEDVAHGLENAPEQFARLMRGENRGKTLVQVAEPEA